MFYKPPPTYVSSFKKMSSKLQQQNVGNEVVSNQVSNPLSYAVASPDLGQESSYDLKLTAIIDNTIIPTITASTFYLQFKGLSLYCNIVK